MWVVRGVRACLRPPATPLDDPLVDAARDGDLSAAAAVAVEGESTPRTGEDDEPEADTPRVLEGLVPPRPEALEEAYAVGRQLGRGRWGEVREVTCRSTGKKFACKITPKALLVDATDLEVVRTEVAVLKHLDASFERAMESSSCRWHTNKLIAAYEDNRKVALVLDLCPGEELLEHISRRHRYSERDAARIFRQIVEAISHLHACGVLHGDVKPQNLVYDGVTGDLRLVDFGLAAILHSGEQLTDIRGSVPFMSPEMVTGVGYGFASDMWSCGVLLFILLTGCLPFVAEDSVKTMRAIAHGSVDYSQLRLSRLSRGARDMLKGLLQLEPSARFTATDVLAHPWLTNRTFSKPRCLAGLRKALGIQDIDTDLGLAKEALMRMGTMGKLHLLARHAVAEELVMHDYASLRRCNAAFNELDLDRSGEVSREEALRRLCSGSAELSRSELVRFGEHWEAFERSSGGGERTQLSFVDFVALACFGGTHSLRPPQFYDLQLYRAAFARIDANGDGFISPAEAHSALDRAWISCSESALKAAFESCDLDGDGKICLSEFLTLLEPLECCARDETPNAWREVERLFDERWFGGCSSSSAEPLC